MCRKRIKSKRLVSSTRDALMKSLKVFGGSFLKKPQFQTETEMS